jgi:signal transduction histidine kinase
LILIAGFIFLETGVIFSTLVSSLTIGFIADFQFYANIPGHYYFVNNPDKLLLSASLNILGILIFGWMLYKFSKNIKILSDNIVERDYAIKNTAKFNKELINSFSQGIIVLNQENNIVFINKAGIDIAPFEAFKGLLDSRAGMLYYSNIKINDIFENFPLEILKKEDGGNEPVRFEVKFKDRIIGFSYSKFIDLYNYKGDMANYGRKTNPVMPALQYAIGRRILLFRDITYIKQMEIDAKINEGLIATGKLAGWLAHEIRNPLSAINTSIDILSTENFIKSTRINKADAKNLINIIKTESIRLESLVRDFLGFVKTKTESGIDEKRNFEYFNLFSFVDFIISQSYTLQNDKIKIINKIDPDVIVFSEKHRLQQIFINIIENSIYACKSKFSNIKDIKRGLIKVSAKIFSNDNHISIMFLDNGCGIDENIIKNVFKPLFTTKKEGTGLGLSIVKSIVDNLNGLIEIKSKINKGTLILIKLPLYEK